MDDEKCYRYRVLCYPLDRGGFDALQIGMASRSLRQAKARAYQVAKRNVPRAETYIIVVEEGTKEPRYAGRKWRETERISTTRSHLIAELCTRKKDGRRRERK